MNLRYRLTTPRSVSYPSLTRKCLGYIQEYEYDKGRHGPLINAAGSTHLAQSQPMSHVLSDDRGGRRLVGHHRPDLCEAGPVSVENL